MIELLVLHCDMVVWTLHTHLFCNVQDAWLFVNIILNH